MKRKTLKQTAVAALLTSSILSFTPTAYGKTTSIQQSIDSVKVEMKRAPLYYVEPALNGKIESSALLYPVLNSVKKNYQKVREDILVSKLSEKEKQAKLNELDTLYDQKITKGLIPYIDAYNFALKYLDPLLKEIKEAEAKNDFATVEKAYHKISEQLKSRTSIFYRFTGQAPRNLLLEKYKQPAIEERSNLLIPVTIYIKLNEAEHLFSQGKNEEAKKVLERVNFLVAKLPNPATNKFINALLKEVEKVQSVVIPPASKPDTPASGDEGNIDEDIDSSKETSGQRELRLVKGVAAAIPSTFEPAVGFAGTVSFPTVAPGYSIAIKSSSDESKYDLDGKIQDNGNSNVIYTVKHIASGKTADTGSVNVKVTITPQ